MVKLEPFFGVDLLFTRDAEVESEVVVVLDDIVPTCDWVGSEIASPVCSSLGKDNMFDSLDPGV